MIFKDYYKILGLESNKATLDEIKTAYREKAKKYHPDMNVGRNEPEIEEIFKDINEAYKTLSNEKTRRKYDFNWNKYIGKRKSKSTKQEKKSIKDILMDIFLGGITRKKIVKKLEPEYGENINTEIDVTIEEAFFGTGKKIKFRTIEGKEISFSIKVPAGIQNGDIIKIAGQGKAGKNGGKNGDLLIVINIKSTNKLQLIGNDLYIQMSLKDWEAALGTEKTIEILNEKINIIVPKSTSSGDKIVIKDKGYRNVRGDRGNLYITTKIELPKKLTPELINIYSKLKEMQS